MYQALIYSLRVLMMPIALTIFLFSVVAALVAYVTLKKRKRVAEVNLKLCFPRFFLSRKILLFKVFVNFCYGIWEALAAWHLPVPVLKLFIRNETSREITREIKSGSGCLFICPHYSSLEMVAPALATSFGNIVMTYRPHDNKRIEKTIVRGRSRFGNLIDVKEIRMIISALTGAAQLWFGPDQDKGLKGSVFSTFFEVPASTVTTPARLARITGVPVYFVGFRRKFLKYQMRLEKFPSDYPSDDEVLNADILNRFIERALKRDPSQYMWFHRRFKTQPEAPRYSLYE